MQELFIGLGISSFLLFFGTVSWYHPTLFLFLFDQFTVDPWPQLSFTPAAYLGGLFFAFTVGVNLYYVQAIVGVGIGSAILLRHERNPRGADPIWPSRAVGKAIFGSGGVFMVVAIAATVGIIEPL